MISDRGPGVAQMEAQPRLGVPPSLPGVVLRGLVSFTRRKPSAAVGGAIILLAILVAILAPVISPYDPQQIAVAPKFTGPGSDALLGTDQLGRDILSRLIHGARVSMYVGLMSTLIGITAGTAIGIFSAYVGGKIDLAIQRLIDALMAFPPIILASETAGGPTQPRIGGRNQSINRARWDICRTALRPGKRPA